MTAFGLRDKPLASGLNLLLNMGGDDMGKRKYQCKWCGTPTSKASGVCWACTEKLALIRKLLKMVRDTAESVRGNAADEKLDVPPTEK